MSEYGYSVEVAEGYDEAILRARLALKSQGFSILTESHVGGLLGREAGSDRQYLFMAVWNAALDQRRIDSDLQVAVHLPCNVLVQENDGSATVAALDPADAIEAGDDAPADLLASARDAIGRALEKVMEPL